MLPRFELPLLSQLAAFEDDPAPFDPYPEWFGPGLKPSLCEDGEGDGGLGLRSLLDQPEVLWEAWRRAGREPHGHRAHRARRRHGARVPGP